MNDLQKIRKYIDSIDHKIIDLLAQRMSYVKKIGEIKKDVGVDPLDTNRWQHLLADRIEYGEKRGTSLELIKKIWNAIHIHALEIEKNNE